MRFWIGPLMFGFGIIIFLSIRLFEPNFHGVIPDVIFGAIDNGILAILT